jgi:hypothetical protein
VLEACKGAPDTVRPPTTVEEACERKAEERVARPEKLEVLSTARVLKSLAAPVTCNVDEAERFPPTFKVEAAVEDACDTNPPARVAKPVLESVPELVSDVKEPEPAVIGIPEARIEPPVTVRPDADASPPPPVEEIPPAKVEVAVPPTKMTVEEAWIGEPATTSPPLLIVEDAVAINPPEELREKTVVEEMFWTTNGFPLCPPVIRRVRRFAVVEVAPMVRTDLTSAEVVPMDTLSVWVINLTNVPSSVQPDMFPVSASVPQTMFPEESVSRVEAPLQFKIVDILSPPAATSNPLRVLVAELVCKIFPPVIVRPEPDERPPMEATDIPPANVEVPVPPTNMVEDA